MNKRERIAEGVYKRLDNKGILTYYISYQDAWGKLKWEKVGRKNDGITPQFCKQVRSQRTVDVKHGTSLPRTKTKVLFDEIANDFIENAFLTMKDKDGPKQRYEFHIKNYIGFKPVETISKRDVEDILKTMIVKGLRPATVDRVRQTISAMFNLAIYNEKCKINPASIQRNDNVSLMRRNKKNINNERERFLSKEEANKLLNELEMRSYKTYVMALISLTTGARAGEILGIQFKDIDYVNSLITLTETKNGTSRKINLAPRVKALIDSIPVANPNDYLFQNPDGKRLTKVSVTFAVIADRLFNIGLNSADSKHRVVFHTLRHTFASWLAIDGVPIFTIQKLMGHKDISQTMRYAKLSQDIAVEAVRNLEGRYID
jgi:integrase